MLRQQHPSEERRSIHGAIDEHGAMVYRLAYRVLGNQADAEDAAQEVFIKLLRARRSTATQVTDERGWLAVTALNLARNLRRGEHNRKRREAAWAVQSLQLRSGQSIAPDGEIWRSVDTLPDELKVPLLLHYQEGFKYREIAQALRCPEGTVATRIANAKERIRSSLARNGAAENHGSNRTSPTSRA